MPEEVRPEVRRRVWEGDAGAPRVRGQARAYARARAAPPNTMGAARGIALLRPEQRDGTGHQWDHPPLPAVAGPRHVCGTLEPHGTGRELTQLLPPCPRSIQEAQEDGSTSPGSGGEVWLLEDRRDG